MKQPATVLEVFEICESEKKAAEQRQNEDQQSKIDKMKSRSKHGR
mgnify:FL=1